MSRGRRPRCVQVLMSCLATSCLALAAVGCSRGESQPATARSWDPGGAAAYLDRRMNWWIGWGTAARDHGTFCVSCHTAVPYALARPALRTALGETGPSPGEITLVDNVIQRVRRWN